MRPVNDGEGFLWGDAEVTIEAATELPEAAATSRAIARTSDVRARRTVYAIDRSCHDGPSRTGLAVRVGSDVRDSV